MYSMKREKGFAVLTSALLLSIAGIAFTANMASTQLIDNQIVANYYRNNEAFINAESGMNFVLSKLTDSALATQLLSTLPTEYPDDAHHYRVEVKQIDGNTLQIISYGTSVDGSAHRTIQLEANYLVNRNPPVAPLSSNGKLNIDSTANLNDGCEGLTAADCISDGNISAYMIISNPDDSVVPDPVNEVDLLCFANDSLDANNISTDAYYGDHSNERVVDNKGDWGDVLAPEGSVFFGIASDSNLDPGSLFEATFGIEKNESNMSTLENYALLVDMTINGALSCSEQLQRVTEDDVVIYIKGDCDISQADASKSASSENKRFTIGSVENPKMVFIEGGTFINQPNTGASVVGLLYFLPGEHNVVDADGNIIGTEEDLSVDMGGIRVNGALLTEYKCSHDGYDKTDKNGTKQHFSARYDKTVLNDLYEDAGGAAASSNYSIKSGTWRDF
ncbi:MAG: hypothetical protein ACJAT7_000077 [Psychromonas sp.]|jgi:hypothetical protein|uniref:hypothetical protein n=1 Tax=Psychromonas sp. TaxID=1884585 RepID=UPI0039E623C3